MLYHNSSFLESFSICVDVKIPVVGQRLRYSHWPNKADFSRRIYCTELDILLLVSTKYPSPLSNMCLIKCVDCMIFARFTVFLNFIRDGEQKNLDAIAREKIVKFVLSLMGEYFKAVEDRLELEV